MKKRIKIGVFIDGDFIPSYDGASNRFHYLSRHLSLQKNVDIVVFHGYRGWSDISKIKSEPFKTYVIPIDQYYGNLELIASIIMKESIDIIQFDNLEPLILQGVPLKRMTGVKLISEMHYVVRDLATGLGASSEKIDEIIRMEKAVGCYADHVICLTNEDAVLLKEYMNIPADKISVISSGVDCKEVRYVGPNVEEKNIIFLGNLYFKPNEDAVRIIKHAIYPKLRKNGYRFTIAGDCPPGLKKELRAKDFIFTGVVPDLNDLFKTATFALVPINEGTGLRIKILNYMRAGIPFISTSSASHGFKKKDLIIENDYSLYANRILELLKKEIELKDIAEKLNTIIENKYDWSIIARRTAKVYEKVYKKKSSTEIDTSILLKNSQPVWIQEAISKKRFKKISNPSLLKNFSYCILYNGCMEVFKLEKIVALEGMPGVGKSTYTKRIGKDKKIYIFPELQIKSKVLLCEDTIETSKQFLLSENKKFLQLRNISKKYKKVVMDRTFISTLAYCYARSKINKNPKEYLDLIRFFDKIKDKIILPTHIIYLDVSVEESLKRRIAYIDNTKYKNWFDHNFLVYFNDFYKTEIKNIFSLPVFYIDTTSLDKSEVARRIGEIIYE